MATTIEDAQQSFFVYEKDNNTGIVTRIAFTPNVQVGTSVTPSAFKLFGSFGLNTSTYITDTNNLTYQMSDYETVLNVQNTNSLANVSVVLPNSQNEGQLHYVKDITGTASGSAITISANGITIDGVTTKVLNSSYGMVAVYFSNNQWYSITSGGGSGGGNSVASYVVMSNDPTLPNDRVLTAGTNIIITDAGPGGNVMISATGGGGSGDPNASYVVLSTTASLSNERALTAGTNISIVDGGANGNVTVSSTVDTGASYITVANTGSLSNERALTAGAGISITDGGANSSITISTSLLGAVPIYVPPSVAGGIDDEFDSSTLNAAWIFRDLTTGPTNRTPTAVSPIDPNTPITGATAVPQYAVGALGRRSHLLIKTTTTGGAQYMVYKPFTWTAGHYYYMRCGGIERLVGGGGGIVGIGIWAATGGVPDQSSRLLLYFNNGGLRNTNGASTTGYLVTDTQVGYPEYLTLYNASNALGGTASWFGEAFSDNGTRIVCNSNGGNPNSFTPAYIGFFIANVSIPEVTQIDFIREQVGHPLFTKQ